MVCVVAAAGGACDVPPCERACGVGERCVVESRRCEPVDEVHCATMPDLCRDEESCDARLGYCRTPVAGVSTYDVQVEHVALTLDPPAGSFEGELRVYAVAARDLSPPGAPADELILGLGREDDGTPSLDVLAVTDGAGRPLAYAAMPDHLRVLLPMVEEQEGFVVRVTWRGDVVAVAAEDGHPPGLVERPDRSGAPVLQPNATSESGAAAWMPVVQALARRQILDVRLPTDDREIVGSGEIAVDAPLRDGRRRVFVQRTPVRAAPYFAAGRFRSVEIGRVGDVPIVLAAGDADHDLLDPAHVQAVVRTFEHFESLIGRYAFERHTTIVAPLGTGPSFAAPGVSVVGAHELDGRYALHLLRHELAHQWFGVGTSASDPRERWMSEALAEVLTAEAADAESPGSYTQSAYNWGAACFGAPARCNDAPLRPDEPTGVSSDHGSFAIYQKGPAVLSMLRAMLGPAEWHALLARLYARHLHVPYDTQSLLFQLEDATGEDLTWFAEQWILRTGWPQIEIRVEVDDAGLHTIEAAQVQDLETHGTYTLEGALAPAVVFFGGEPGCRASLPFPEGQVTSGPVSPPCSSGAGSFTAEALPRVLAEVRFVP